MKRILLFNRYPYIFGELFCQLRGLFAEMSANATVLTITAFTAERYVAICHPFMAQSMSKLSRAVKLIVVIWLVAALFAIPQVSANDSSRYHAVDGRLCYYYNGRIPLRDSRCRKTNKSIFTRSPDVRIRNERAFHKLR